MTDSLLRINEENRETCSGQEFLEVGCKRGHGPKRAVAPLNNNNNNNNNNNGLAIQISRRNRNHFLHIISPEISNTPYIAKSQWEVRFFAPVQTGPGAHPASCTMGTGSFPGAESGRGVTLTPHPFLVPLVMKE